MATKDNPLYFADRQFLECLSALTSAARDLHQMIKKLPDKERLDWMNFVEQDKEAKQYAMVLKAVTVIDRVNK